LPKYADVNPPSVAAAAQVLQVTGAGPQIRLVDLVPGQVLQATVAQLLEGNRVLLGLLGGILEAASTVELKAGRSYWLTVARTEPTVVLTPTRAPGGQGPEPATPTGHLSVGAAELGKLVREAHVQEGSAVAQVLLPEQATREAPVWERLLRAPESPPGARELLQLHRTLGHDQEARVLRLPQTGVRLPVEVAELQTTLKALALLRRAAGHEAGEPRRTSRAAHDLVLGLNQAEVDNAGRSEQGLPQWLPLLAAEGGPLREARMFLVGDGGAESAGPTGERTLTIVLLLELTRLGPVRVDIAVRGSQVAATFLATQASALGNLADGLPGLRAELEAAGLVVQSLRLQQARELPLADLVHRLVAAVPTSLVDVHA
jgi:hypothetical protein